MTPSQDTAKPSGFAANDRAASYGDGVFTTMRVAQGRVALFDYHVRRLIADAGRLAIRLEQAAVATAIRQAARTSEHGVVKVLVSAGEGGRGYARNADSAAALHVSHHPLPAHYASSVEDGFTLTTARTRLASQPLLAGIKHLNRLEQVLVKQELKLSQADDALVCDYQGQVIEASAANVFWFRDGTWYTPDLSNCGVNGVMRSFIVDWMKKHNVPFETGQFSLDVCLAADSMMLTNALMELMPVSRVTHNEQAHHYSLAPVHAMRAAIASDYRESYA